MQDCHDLECLEGVSKFKKGVEKNIYLYKEREKNNYLMDGVWAQILKDL